MSVSNRVDIWKFVSFLSLFTHYSSDQPEMARDELIIREDDSDIDDREREGDSGEEQENYGNQRLIRANHMMKICRISNSVSK